MKPRTLTWLALTCLLVGCQPAKPLEQKVPAATSEEFSAWRRHEQESLVPEQWNDFDVAVQEIRIRVMIDKVATGGEAVDEAMRARINGLTVCQVLQMGYRSRLDRLTGERTELEAVIAANAKVRTLPGHTESEDALREKRRLQADDLNEKLERIKQVEEKLRLYDPGFSGKN